MNPSNDTSAAGLDQLLGGAAPRPWWRRKTPWLVLALALAALAAALVWRERGAGAAALPRFQTEPVQRGTLNVQVVANGTLAPTLSVNIGSELSGTVAKVLVDINDTVAKGQVLAELDTTKLRDQMARSRATLASAEARVAQAAATLVAMSSNFALNNLLTYRDMRLRGWGLLRGWASFVAACSIGGLANVGIADYLFHKDSFWITSAIAGVLVGVVWNYAVTAVVTWKRTVTCVIACPALPK